MRLNIQERNNNYNYLLISILTIIVSGCVAGKPLSTQMLKDAGLDKTAYNVILYGMETPYDVETVAVLDKTDDAFQIISASQLNYSVYENLSTEDAMQLATSFLKRSVIYKAQEQRAILSPEGQIIGYEIRPIFNSSQVNNNYYYSSYSLQPDGTVQFQVFWQGFYKPFSGDSRR